MAEEKLIKAVSDFPNSIHSLSVAIREHDTNLLRNLQVCFPACVYSYDRTTHQVEVMPLVKQAFFQGEWHFLNRQPYKTTVRSIQCGGYTIDFPLYIGDTGWVIASDRDTALIKGNQTPSTVVLEKSRKQETLEDYYQQSPSQRTIHSYSDGFFIPDNWGRWDSHRFKDDVAVSIADSVYIGASIDTPDEDDSISPKQEGKSYEDKPTSSVVIQKSGGAYLLSSTKKDENGHTKNARVCSINSKAEMSAVSYSESNPISSSIYVDSSTGVVIRRDNPNTKRHCIATMLEDGIEFRLVDAVKKKSVDISFIDGQLHVSTSDAINILSLGDVNVKSKKNAYVTAEEARVVASKTASVAAETITAAAEKKVHVAGGEQVSVASGDSINISGGNKINVTTGAAIDIVAASDINIMAKKIGGSIIVSALSKDAEIGIVTEGENSNIALQSEGIGSQINISTKGEDSNIFVDAEKGDVVIGANTNATISAEKINLNGNVDILGELKINDTPVNTKQHEGENFWGF